MGENSGIAWTDHSHSHWRGCQSVSPACEHCYAEKFVAGRKKEPWGPNEPRTLAAESTRKAPLAWNRKAAKEGRRHRVFAAHYSDVFDNRAPDEWRSELWALIRATTNLDWLLLTKRPQNIAKMLPFDWGVGYPHVWLGITAENQVEFDRRWPALVGVPAAVRFVSYEPALGPLALGSARPDWLIVGCESGTKRRPMAFEWARAIRDESEAAGVSFFMKQMQVEGRVTDDIDAFPADLQIRQFPGARA